MTAYPLYGMVEDPSKRSVKSQSDLKATSDTYPEHSANECTSMSFTVLHQRYSPCSLHVFIILNARQAPNASLYRCQSQNTNTEINHNLSHLSFYQNLSSFPLCCQPTCLQPKRVEGSTLPDCSRRFEQYRYSVSIFAGYEPEYHQKPSLSPRFFLLDSFFSDST